MKKTKLLIASAVMLAVLSVNATRITETVKPSTKTWTESKASGVSDADVQRYLETCSHHHTVYWVQSIVGTPNFYAGIENCGTATVYTEGGIISQHSDNVGPCSM